MSWTSSSVRCRRRASCVSNDDRLDRLEETADNLVPKLRVRIALCKSCQIWAEIDNGHAEAQETRRRLEDDTEKLVLKLESRPVCGRERRGCEIVPHPRSGNQIARDSE